MSFDPSKLIESLARQRPVFHSEADFQHAFAWTIQTAHPAARMRLERPFRTDAGAINLDLLVTLLSERVAIELKYLTRRLAITVEGEAFELQQHSAHPLRRHDVWKDVARLEALVQAGAATAGYAIVVSNDPAYWNAGRGQGIDTAFRLDEGRRVGQANLTWETHAGPGTVKNREEPISIAGCYTLRWQPYSRLSDGAGEFRCLILSVGSGAGQPV